MTRDGRTTAPPGADIPLAVPETTERQPRGVRGQVLSAGATVGRWLERIIYACVAFVLLAELAVVFGNIVLRFGFGVNLDWALEVSEFALVFLTFVGGALAYKQNAHMRVRALVDALPGEVRPYVASAVDAVVFATALLLTLNSLHMLHGQETTPILGVPVAWLRAPLPVGMLLMTIFAAGRLFTHPWRVMRAILPVVSLAAVAFVKVSASPPFTLSATLVAFAILLAMSAPIGFVFAAASILYVQQMKAGMLSMVPLHMHHGASAFVLLAVPFFVLAGMVMTEGGLAQPMSDFIVSLIGRFRGGLFQVIVVGMYIFSGISGSKVADMVAVGTTLTDMLKRQGYPPGETAAVLSASAAMGETVPPSIPMLVLASVSTLSVATLFIAGLLPAALIALCLMVAIYFRARKLGLKGSGAAPFRDVAWKGMLSIPAFAMPVILVVGILAGVSTPTEVSTFAVVYGILMAVALYRSLDRTTFWKVLGDACSMTGNVLFIVSAAGAFSWVLTYARVPQRLAGSLDMLRSQPWLFTLACLVLLVVMGSLLEGLPVILIFAPILLPIVPQFGINPLQFGIVMIIAMGIGLFSPPTGLGIYFAAAIAGTTVEKATKPMLYYLLVLLIGLLLVAYLPEVTLVLPRLVGMRF